MWNFCLFELKYRLRSLTPYIFAVILSWIFINRLLLYLRLYATGKRDALNGSFSILGVINKIPFLIVFMMAVIIYQMFYKTINKKFYEVIFSKPIRKYQYILGSFIANLIVMFGAFIMAMIVYRLALCLPMVPSEYVNPDNIWFYITPAFIIILPNLIVCGCLCISAVLLTKRTSSIFVVCFIYLILYYVQKWLYTLDESWLDFLYITGMWQVMNEYFALSPTDWQYHVCGLSLYSIMNRVVWLVIGFIALFFGMKRFDYDFTK